LAGTEIQDMLYSTCSKLCSTNYYTSTLISCTWIQF
jgi:hypothetical protein